MRRALALVLVALVAHRTAAAQQRSFSTRSRASLDTAVTLGTNGLVSLTAGSGNITVVGTSGNQVRVRATSDHENIRFDATSVRVTVDLSGGRSGDSTRGSLERSHRRLDPESSSRHLSVSLA